MRYTIPYDDKVTLPHIKQISTIGIDTDNLYYDSRELSGEVIISGEYLLDNSKDIMEFKHDIPVSFLIDDDNVNPQINISNFKYELIPGRGIEVMFELDVILVELTPQDNEEEKAEEAEVLINQRIDEIDKELAENQKQLDSLTNSSEDNKIKRTDEVEEEKDEDAVEFVKQIDENLNKLIGDRSNLEDVKVEVEEEVVVKEEKVEEVKETKKSKKQKASKKESALQSVLEEEKVTEEVKEIEVEIENDGTKVEVEIENKLTTKLHSTNVAFDTGFISSKNDRYTTYKILLLEESENIDDVLNAKNLSRALICDEFKSDDKKVVLKIENDGN